MKILFGVLFVVSIAGILVTIITPFFYKNLYPNTSEFLHNKVLAYRPVLVLVFVVIMAAATAGWQNISYDSSSDSGVGATGSYIQNLYPIYKSRYKVLGVVDGTSAKIDLNHRATPVDLIGVEPFAAQDKGVNDCYEEHSKTKLSELLKGKSVELEGDDSLIGNEKVDALVGYMIADNKNIAREMIGLGFAKAASKKQNYKYYEEFMAAQNAAEEKGLGLWSKTICKVLPGSGSGSSIQHKDGDNTKAKITNHVSSPDQADGRKADVKKEEESAKKCSVKLLIVCIY